jgi:hypothetical protein
MAFEIAPDPGEKGVPETGTTAPGGADLGERRQIVADGFEVLAHGALVCPECALPIAIESRIGAGSEVACPFCAHGAPAREFVRPDVFDAVANEVYLVARVAA